MELMTKHKARWSTSTVLLLGVGLFVSGCASLNVRQAVTNGDLASTRQHLETKGESPESPNDCGWTLLHLASYYQYPPLVEYLIQRKANVNAATAKHSDECMAYSKIPAGSTPLIIAAYYGQADIIDMLVRAGADRSRKNAEGYTALMYARKFEFSLSARALEAAGQ